MFITKSEKKGEHKCYEYRNKLCSKVIMANKVVIQQNK